MRRFEPARASAAEAVEKALRELLPEPNGGPEQRLFEAMRYAVFSGGKRIRPFLVYESASLFAVSPERAGRVAAAVEMVHCYSLVHDDLPCMDDDDLRRGRPTVHVQYDEATAVLVGDALLTLAFEVLTDAEASIEPRVRMELIRRLAVAVGGHGMVGGQMLDLVGETRELDHAQIVRMQRMKTGELIAFAASAGAVLAAAPRKEVAALQMYAHDLGLAFQITDDLLDVRGSSAETGKSGGKDAAAGKATFVSLLGEEEAQAHARMLLEQAAAHLEPFGEKAQALRELCGFVINRRA